MMLERSNETVVVVHDRCVADVSDLAHRMPRAVGPQLLPFEVPVHPGGWIVNFVEAPMSKIFVNSARSPEERTLAQRGSFAVTAYGRTFMISLTVSDAQDYRRFYERFTNPVIWKLQHNLLDGDSFGPREWNAYREGYVKVNLNTARNVYSQVVSQNNSVIVSWQDYQWYLAPRFLRNWLDRGSRTNVAMHQFVHIPFPEPNVWTKNLPAEIWYELFWGLLSNNVVGFHTAQYVENFLRCCSELLDCKVDEATGVVHLPSGRSTLVRPYPLPVSHARLGRIAESKPVLLAEQKLLSRIQHRRLIFRTERVDPAKDFLGCLRAYKQLLRHSDLNDDVVLFAQLVPSRQSVPDWRSLRWTIEREADQLNKEFATERWTPLQVDFIDDMNSALAGYKLYDVLDIVPHADGMNLVSLEGPLLNCRDGTLVLSRTAGSYSLLQPYCIGVPPGDVDTHRQRLAEALRLPTGEKRRRSRGLKQRVSGGNPIKWLDQQLLDTREYAAGGYLNLTNR